MKKDVIMFPDIVLEIQLRIRDAEEQYWMMTIPNPDHRPIVAAMYEARRYAAAAYELAAKMNAKKYEPELLEHVSEQMQELNTFMLKAEKIYKELVYK